MRSGTDNKWMNLVEDMCSYKAKDGKEVKDRDGSIYVVDKTAVINDPVRNTQQFSNKPMYEGHEPSTHLIADDDNLTAWATIFQDEEGNWFEGGRKEAEKRGEVYKFDTREEMINFARKGNWKKKNAAQTGLEILTNPIRKRLAENLYPVSYAGDPDEDGVLGGPLDKLMLALSGEKSIFDDRTYDPNKDSRGIQERTDLLQILMGQDQIYNTIVKSKYKPTEGEDTDGTFYSSPFTEDILRQLLNDNGWDAMPNRTVYGGGPLGNYTLDKGEDERGKYVSYYDKWDVNPFEHKKGLKGMLSGVADWGQSLMGITPPEIYGRVYVEEASKLQKGGTPITLPEVKVSALTDESYNKLTDAQKQVYDSFIGPDGGVSQTVDIGNDYWMHWSDALKMVDDVGVRNIYNRPNIFMDYGSKGDINFRPHANPFFKNIHIPKLAEEGDPHYIQGANDMMDIVRLGEAPWVKKMSEQERADFLKRMEHARDSVNRTNYFSDLIAELAHIPEFWRSETFKNIPITIKRRIERGIEEGSIPDYSNYRDPKDIEYHTHTGPNSFEQKLREKYGYPDAKKLKNMKHGGNHHEWADYDLTRYQDGDEIDQEEEFKLYNWGNTGFGDWENPEYFAYQFRHEAPKSNTEYLKTINPIEVNTGKYKNFLVDQLKSPLFRERYREQFKLVTGEYPSDEELDARVNAQISNAELQPDFAIQAPFANYMPNNWFLGIQTSNEDERQEFSPLLRPYEGHPVYGTINPAAAGHNFVNVAGQANSRLGRGYFSNEPIPLDPKQHHIGHFIIANDNLQKSLSELSGIREWDLRDLSANELRDLALEHNLPIGQQFKYPGVFAVNSEDPYGGSLRLDGDIIFPHEYGHTFNTEDAPLFRLYNLNPYLYGEAKRRREDDNLQNLWSYDFQGHDRRNEDGTWENPYQEFIMNDLFEGKIDLNNDHATQMQEISSAKQETLAELFDRNLWDVTGNEKFSSVNLDNMLNAEYMPSWKKGEASMHLDAMGYTNLLNNTKKINKNNRSIENITSQITQGNNKIEDFNNLSREDKFNFLTKIYDNFNEDGDIGGEEYKRLNKRRKKGKKYNAAVDLFIKNEGEKYINSLQEKINKNENRVNDMQLEIENINEENQKIRPKVEEKLDIYFNQLVQNEEIGDDIGNPMMAKFGTEMDTDEVADKYDMQTVGLEEGDVEWQNPPTDNTDVMDPVATKHGGELSVWNRKRYSTPAKMFKKGGETIKEKEKRAKHRSYTGDWYVGPLDKYRIDDLYDFNNHTWKGDFNAEHPEILKWRSSKGFKAMELLNWYYLTQYLIPYNTNTEGVTNVRVEDGSTWKNKNYGYITRGRAWGSEGSPGDIFESESFYPKDHSQAHAMARDLRGIMGLYFFYEGQPFTNEEGDEYAIRMGLKPGKQIQELESRLKAANSKSEVTKIMQEFYEQDEYGNYVNIDLESINYILNKTNPYNFSDGLNMKIINLSEEYNDTLNYARESRENLWENADPSYTQDAGTKQRMEDNIYNDYKSQILGLIMNEIGEGTELKRLPDDMNSEDLDIYIDNVLKGEITPFYDNEVMKMINHSELAQFGSKKEFDDWVKSEAFKNGFWNPNDISYVGANGEIVSGKDIDLPYETMYDTYNHYGRKITVDPFDGQPKFRIYSKEEALASNIFPVDPAGWTGGKPNTWLGAGLSWASNLVGGDDIQIDPLFGAHSGTEFALYDLPVPEHNPYKEYFHWYEYDDKGMVSKTHTFRNPTYDSHSSKEYRRIYGPKGDGVGGTITENPHKYWVTNFLTLDRGPNSTKSLANGAAINNNPYYNTPDFMGRDQMQKTQPHQWLYMNEDEIKNKFVESAGKNQNKAAEWNGALWVSGGLLTTQLLRAGLMKGATWNTAGNTIKNYWKNPTSKSFKGYAGATWNTGSYILQGTSKLYDRTSLGRITGYSPVPGLNINNLALGGFAYNDLTNSYEKFSQGDVWGGTYDLGWGALNTGLLYGRLQNAYNTQNLFNYGKFPDLTNVNKIGNVNINPQVAGPMSQYIRQNVPAWSLRDQTNRLFNRNIFQPQITQPKLTTEFGNLLKKQQMNQYGDFSGVVPKFNLLPPNYKLGDLSKNKIVVE